MTKELHHRFFQGFENDPDIYSDMNRYSEYTYCEEDADNRWERQQKPGRVHLAVMLEQDPIGEVILKEIDEKNRNCTLSIHLKNDSVKNRGFGTLAEKLTLRFAFESLSMETVYADAIQKNKRSQHVLEKAGFQKTHSDKEFIYYRCDKDNWVPESENP